MKKDDVYERVFKRYDIRGYYPKEIDVLFSFRLGLALGKYIIKNGLPREIIIGGDLRESTPILKDAFINGIYIEGIKVMDVGIAPTDLVALMSKRYSAMGVEITASHNPFTMNGFKFMFDSLPLTNEKLKEIKDIFLYEIKEDELEESLRKTNEKDLKKEIYMEVHYDAYKEYINTMLRSFNMESIGKYVGEKIGFFVQNSSVSPILRYIKRNFDSEINILEYAPYMILDEFSAELNREALEKIINDYDDKEILFFFDPDGDRLVIYDSEIGILEGNRMLACFALSLNPESITTSIDFSEIYAGFLEEKGIKVFRTKVGDVFVSNEAKKSDSEIFGEPNNHIGFSKISYYHSGFASSIFYIKNREEILKHYRHLPDIYVDVLKISPYRDVDSVVEKISNEKDIEIISRIDGIKMEIDGGYVLIRTSGTEDVMRITIEAPNKTKFDKLRDLIYEILRCKR